MTRRIKKIKLRRKKAGLPPGAIVFTGSQKVERVSIHYLLYDKDQLMEESYHNHADVTFRLDQPNMVDWYDVRGLHDTELIETLGQAFDIHPLVLEDVVDISQRPKLEEYEKGIFFLIRALHFERESMEIKTEQVGIYFRKSLAISFQETDTDLFEPVRKRLHAGKGRIRWRGADYLVYTLLDVIVDRYFEVTEQIEQVIEELEEKILQNPSNEIREDLHHLKKELLAARKSIAPLREAIGRFSKLESEFVDEGSRVFIRDLYDHTIDVIDVVESYRDMLNGLHDLYVSEISFKMNQVMQVLTIITTIFVPLSFLAGLYGMNFANMPELNFQYGYFFLLGVMALLAGLLLWWFRRKKWL